MGKWAGGWISERSVGGRVGGLHSTYGHEEEDAEAEKKEEGPSHVRIVHDVLVHAFHG